MNTTTILNNQEVCKIKKNDSNNKRNTKKVTFVKSLNNFLNKRLNNKIDFMLQKKISLSFYKSIIKSLKYKTNSYFMKTLKNNIDETSIYKISIINWNTILLHIFNISKLSLKLNDENNLIQLFHYGINYINNIILYSNKQNLKNNIAKKNISKKTVSINDRKYTFPQIMAEKYYKKLLDIMENKKPFKDPNLSLYDLASLLDLKRNQLSYIINVYSSQNFYTFINQYRLEEAKKCLEDMPHEKFSILEIAFESGFNSKSTFNRFFKEYTSMTPKEYRKKIYCINNLN